MAIFLWQLRYKASLVTFGILLSACQNTLSMGMFPHSSSSGSSKHVIAGPSDGKSITAVGPKETPSPTPLPVARQQPTPTPTLIPSPTPVMMPTPPAGNPVSTSSVGSSLLPAGYPAIPSLPDQVNGTRKIGLFYLLWHCPVSSSLSFSNGNIYDISKILSGIGSFAGIPSFHWWSEPDQGYYCLADNDEILATHAKMIAEAGIDFVFVDSTNNLLQSQSQAMVIAPFNALMRVWSRIPGAPKVVPWLPITDASDMTNYFDNMLQQYPQMAFVYQGKPLLLSVGGSDSRIASYSDRYTVRKMGGLLTDAELNAGSWSFMQPCQNSQAFQSSGGQSPCNQSVSRNNGIVEQISVTSAYQRSYMSDTSQGPGSAIPKFHGQTLLRQMETAYNNSSAPIVTITGWNEWIVQRLCPFMATQTCNSSNDTLANGNQAFTDEYNAEYSRDLEPGGGLGVYYYTLLMQAIEDLKGGRNPASSVAWVPYGSNINGRLLDAAVFDWQDYYRLNPDLAAIYGSQNRDQAYKHWLLNGAAEGRQGVLTFSARQYISLYSDINQIYGPANYTGAIQNYVANGLREQRIGLDALSPSVFNWVYYMNSYADLQSAFGIDNKLMAIRHWLSNGLAEGRRASISFWAPDYLQEYPDVAHAVGAANYSGAVTHYVQYGSTEGRLGTRSPASQTEVSFNQAYSNDALLPAGNAIDGNSNTYFSSNFFSSFINSRGSNLVGAMPCQNVSEIDLTARIMGSQFYGFPSSYDVQITTPDNKDWIDLGQVYDQPDLSGKVRIAIGNRTTCGVKIVPTNTSVDDSFLNHYFQLGEMGLLEYQ